MYTPLVSYRVTSAPLINSNYFPETPTNNIYWTSSSYFLDDTKAWTRIFGIQEITYTVYSKSTNGYVRCVRGTPNSHSVRFSRDDTTTPDNPVVYDNVTELTWQGCLSGQHGPDCSSGDVEVKYWSDALLYCENSSWNGYTDWRLPGIEELHSLVSHRSSTLAIDSYFFPETAANIHATSTTYVFDATRPFVVSFDIGMISKSSKTTTTFYVRCVRGGLWD